ncbi:MAG: PocR ligand-binding domain-containing protein [Planctomycetota bacterium]|nr:PocR ligand-binding domain-containing protein [Planctomycetota bacterium]
MPEPRSPATQLSTFNLQRTLADLEALTGFGTSFHNMQGRMPRISSDGAPPKLGQIEPTRTHMTPFCDGLKRTQEGAAACIACDAKRAHLKAAKAGKPVAWRCHAGLTEILVPVVGDGQHLGTIFGGQAVPPGVGAAERAVLRKRWAKLGHDPAHMERLFNRQPKAEPGRFAAFARILGGVAEQAAKRAASAAIVRAQASEKRAPVARAMALMVEHLAEPLSLEEIARHVHLSPSRLSHLFTQQEGESFRDRLLRLRIERAKALLGSTPLPVHEVAARVGYADPNFFSRIFSEKAGLSPREYRRKFAQA